MTIKRKRAISNTVKYILLILMSLVVLLPLSWMVITSLKSMQDITLTKGLALFPTGPTLKNFVTIWSDYPLLTYIMNSISTVGVSTVLAVLFASLAGYGLTRYEFKGKQFFLNFLLVTQMFPAVMKIVPYYKILVNLHLNNTRAGLTIVYASFSIPFCTWMMYGYYKSIPRDLDESAHIDGCSPLQTYFKVVTPLALPGLVATTIYAFLQNWNEYMFASVLMTADEKKTLTYAISTMADAYKVQWNYLMCASIIASIPTMIFFIFLQRYLIAGMTSGAVKE